ncbi:unnamed protein product [Lepeophtheirus salmonis]|uniref:(salmon louse) hypothetical protein n=1 Tax=Lepeophtheirus salmonis TaxID=72036 RepID=A0A7R8CLS2_LEPSM|nr:unnamed protein product [Lepeophtheirus salmonis]CAF2825405.1 unnamed protein product [Lepeophtheirus salmonis]
MTRVNASVSDHASGNKMFSKIQKLVNHYFGVSVTSDSQIYRLIANARAEEDPSDTRVRLDVEMDRRITVRELFLEHDLSLWTVNQILTKDLGKTLCKTLKSSQRSTK